MGNAYDEIASHFNNRDFREQKYIDLLLSHLPSGASILDAGCGTGQPITRYLLERGYSVTGIDTSEGMLAIARRQLPDAQFVLCDMRTFEPAGKFHAIVAWDSVFHIPREQHAALFQKFSDWLVPEGMLLISLGGSAWEGTSEMLGREFFYSGFAPEVSTRILEDCGFSICLTEVDDPTSRGHIAILAQKADCKTKSKDIFK